MTSPAWALLVLMPDAMTAGRWPELWAALGRYDVNVAAATPVLMAPDELGELYAQHARNGGRSPHGVWVSHELAALDTSIALLLRTRRDGLDLSAALRTAKGSSRFGTRDADALREIWPFAEKCQSLLHTSDDADAVPREASIFFGEAVVDAAISGATLPAVEPGDVPALRSYVAAADEPHPYDVVLRALCRGLTLLATTPLAQPDAGWRTARDRVEALRRDLRHAPHATLRERLAAALPGAFAVVPREIAPAFDPGDGVAGLAARRRFRAHVDLAELLPLLASPEEYRARLARHAVEILPANGLWLDHGERHRLTVALTFFHDGGARERRVAEAAWCR